MGHSTIAMTFDTYGHLMPGGLDEARAATDAYLVQLGGGWPSVVRGGVAELAGDPVRLLVRLVGDAAR